MGLLETLGIVAVAGGLIYYREDILKLIAPPPAGCTKTCTAPLVLNSNCECVNPTPTPTPTTDVFGVDKFFPSVGREWFSTAWANGKKRTLQANQFDPDDGRFGYTNGTGFQ